MASRRALAVAVAVVVVMVTVVGADTRFGDCTHTTHCGPDSCCLVGFNRYSVPSCTPRRGLGAPCSLAYFEPVARTLHYPNGITVEIEEAHFGLCPCSSGLVCRMGTCQEPVLEPDSTPSVEYNSIDSEYD